MESDCSMVGVTIKAEEPLHMQSEQESDFSWILELCGDILVADI